MTQYEILALASLLLLIFAVILWLMDRPSPMPPVGFIFANSHDEANRYLADNGLFGFGVVTPRCIDRIRGHMYPHIIVIGELADDFDLYDWPVIAVAQPFIQKKGTDAVR